MLIPIKYNVRYLINRRVGTIMTASTFALVVAVFIIVMSLARGIESAMSTAGDPLNLLIMRPSVQSEGQSSVQIERYQIVRNFPGIARDENAEPLVAPEVIVLINKLRLDGKKTNVQIRGVHPLSFKMRPVVRIVEGRTFRPGMREAIVSQSVGHRFQDTDIGDRIRLGRSDYTIVGRFDARGSAFDSEIWCDYQELMQDYERNAYCTILAHAIDAAAVTSIQKMVDEDKRVKLTAKTEEDYYKEQTKTAGPLKAFGGALAVIMSIGASFAGMNTMYSSIAGRVREIGTLRILGFTPLSIMICFFIESVALALVGSALGCLLSLPINGLATGTANFQTFSEIIFYFTITPELMSKGLMFGLGMGAIGGLLPAISAARQPILSALRHL